MEGVYSPGRRFYGQTADYLGSGDLLGKASEVEIGKGGKGRPFRFPKQYQEAHDKWVLGSLGRL